MMASADVATAATVEAAPIVEAPDSPGSTPHSSAVYSTTSTTALTLDGLSRQNSTATLLGLDEAHQHYQHYQQHQQFQQHQQLQQNGTPRPSIHRVSSEQILATPSDLTASALLATNAARATSMIVGKVTSRRRQRNPRRFVVTELPPEQDEFLQDESPSTLPLPTTTVSPAGAVSGHSNGNGNHATVNGDSGHGISAYANANANANGNAHGDAPTTRAYRPNKMEVRGRFTIIDLSPDSPESSSQPEDAGAGSGGVDHVELPRAMRTHGTGGTAGGAGTANGAGAASRMRRATPPRRFSRTEKSSSMTMTSASAAAMLPESAVLTAAMLRGGGQDDHRHGSSYQGHHHHYGSLPATPYSPHTPQLSPHGVDLNALDRHLVFLQQESLDMKAVLESMISSNARWISALGTSSDSNIGSGKNPKAVHPATSPLAAMTAASSVSSMPPTPPPTVVVPPLPVLEPTLEEKYEKLLAAHSELQQKHEVVSSEAAQLKRSNLMLETRLRQETSVNEELRAHVDQLTQYTESLIYSVGEPPARSQSQNRRKESLSSTSTEVLVEQNGGHDKPSSSSSLVETDGDASRADVGDVSVPSRSPPNKAQTHRVERSVSEVSIDSSALWATDNNQSGLEDDDDSNFDSDGLDPRDARALKALRRRRWRNVSRSTSMSLDDDSASSVYSYRDSWVSLFDPQHSTSQSSDWRAMSYDGAESSVDETLLFDGVKTNNTRLGHHGVGLDERDPSSNNQTDDDPLGRHEPQTLRGSVASQTEPWERRRKSSVMIVEELDDNPADVETAPPSKPVG